ncbi:MAG: hypothetical protein ACTHU0_20935 [Kofleriaceae bacterium]
MKVMSNDVPGAIQWQQFATSGEHTVVVRAQSGTSREREPPKPTADADPFQVDGGGQRRPASPVAAKVAVAEQTVRGDVLTWRQLPDRCARTSPRAPRPRPADDAVTMRNIRRLASVPLALWMLAISGCGLSVTRHTLVPLSDQEANQIFDEAWTLLNNVDGPGDVSCNVNALWQSRTGRNVHAYSAGPYQINSQSDFAAVNSLPEFVKVVSVIRWCRRIESTESCSAPQKNDSMIVTRNDYDEGVTWAHEYGHTRGLGHRDDDPLALMNPNYPTYPSFQHNRVTSVECNAFQQ